LTACLLAAAQASKARADDNLIWTGKASEGVIALSYAPLDPAKAPLFLLSCFDAMGIAVLDLRDTAGFTDYFLIGSGQNPRQIRAIADAVLEALASHGATPAHVDRRAFAGIQGAEHVLGRQSVDIVFLSH